jgi:hypothetical protein
VRKYDQAMAEMRKYLILVHDAPNAHAARDRTQRTMRISAKMKWVISFSVIRMVKLLLAAAAGACLSTAHAATVYVPGDGPMSHPAPSDALKQARKAARGARFEVGPGAELDPGTFRITRQQIRFSVRTSWRKSTRRR